MNLGKWLGLFLLLITLYLLWQIRQILLLLFIAVILATALNRLVRWLQSVGVRQRHYAVTVTMLGFLLVVAGVLAGILPTLIEQIQRLVNLAPELSLEVQQWVLDVQRNLPGEWGNSDRLSEVFNQQLQPIIGALVDRLFTWASDAVVILLKMVLIIVLTAMLLISPEHYRHPLVRLFPAFYRSRIDEVLNECETSLVSWVGGTLITIVYATVMSGLSLWILRIPFGLACALWAGFTELIPNIGYIVGMLLPLVISLLDAPWKAIPIVAIYFFIQQLETYVVVPWVMKEQIAMPPAVTLIAQIVFAFFFGLVGLFLALPLMVVLKIVLRELLVKDLMDQWQRRS